MVSSRENPDNTQRIFFMFDMYSANRVELYADGRGCSKVISPGLGFSSATQFVRFDAGLNHAACAIRFRCMSGQRLSRQSVINSRQRDVIASASEMTWLRPSVRDSGWRTAQTRIGGSSYMEAIISVRNHVRARAVRSGEVAVRPEETSRTPGL